MFIKGDVVSLTLANGREYQAEVVVGQEAPGDLFKARLVKTGTLSEIDPVDIDVKLIRRPEANIIKEESAVMNVETAVQENVVEKVVTNVAPRRKKVVITQETIEAFSRWVDVELPDGGRIQAQFRMLPSGTAGLMRVRLAFLTLSVTVYQSKQDADDIYIPPTKTSYSTKDGDTREVTVIEADEGQSELLKAIAAAVMSELGLSFKQAARTNSPTRGGGTHPVGSKTGNGGRRFSRA